MPRDAWESSGVRISFFLHIVCVMDDCGGPLSIGPLSCAIHAFIDLFVLSRKAFTYKRRAF